MVLPVTCTYNVAKWVHEVYLRQTGKKGGTMLKSIARCEISQLLHGPNASRNTDGDSGCEQLQYHVLSTVASLCLCRCWYSLLFDCQTSTLNKMKVSQFMRSTREVNLAATSHCWQDALVKNMMSWQGSGCMGQGSCKLRMSYIAV